MTVGLIYNPVYLEHDTGEHLENRQRLVEVVGLLERSGLMSQLTPLEPYPASIEEMCLVHTQQHLAHIQTCARSGGGWLDLDTCMCPQSYKTALYAVGGAIVGVDWVMSGDVDSAFALLRPPGHHATADEAMGFCLFNNIAIAASYALKHHHLARVLIVDFDCHHGNGTQEIFYRHPGVMYFSAHQYPFYPGTGYLDEIGEGEAEGTKVNVPLPAHCGDSGYVRTFEEILAPSAQRFHPQLILVSAGFDPHWADPISSMEMSVAGFAKLAAILKELAQELCPGRLLFLLEGGYHLQALAYSVKATLEVLLGNPPTPDPLGSSRYPGKPPAIDGILERVKELHHLPR